MKKYEKHYGCGFEGCVLARPVTEKLHLGDSMTLGIPLRCHYLANTIIAPIETILDGTRRCLASLHLWSPHGEARVRSPQAPPRL
jgi:hypothetical protein